MKIIKNKDLIYNVLKYDVILVGTNIRNTLGNGFQKKIARSFPYVDDANNQLPYNEKEKMGKVLFVPKENLPTFCLCYIFNNRLRPDIISDVVDYDSLSSCLKTINKEFKGKKVASTIIGHSPFEGGGNRDLILAMMKEYLKNVDLYVYDYPQMNINKEDNIKFHDIVNRYNEGKIDKETYYKEKGKYMWEKNFGLYEPIPEGLTYRQLTDEIKRRKGKDKILLY